MLTSSKRIFFRFPGALSFIALLTYFSIPVSIGAEGGQESLKIRPLVGSIYVSGQIGLAHLDAIKAQGFSTLIDLRPDGESADQTPSSEIKAVAASKGMRFFYVPVAPGPIPAGSVEKLQSLLAPEKVLLYCRSGSRATRTFALAQASRQGGPTRDEILSMARSAGYSADDLRTEIERRIAQRKP